MRAAAAALALAIPIAAGAQPAVPDVGGSTYAFFLRGQPIGTEQVNVTRTADGWTIVSAGRLSPPLDAVARRVEVRYTGDWKPISFLLEGAVRGQAQTIRTTVNGTQARSTLTANGQPGEKTDTIDPNAILLLPTTFFGPFEAVAERLKTTRAGGDIPAYGVPALSFTIHVGESSTQQIQTPARMIAARRTQLKFILPGVPLDVDLWTDDAGRMIRVSIPAQSFEFVREDVASVASRTVPISRPNDEPVVVPSNGFSLAGTLSKPVQATPSAPGAAARLPAVVLVGGSGPTDRDSFVFGIPILGQIADALADAGFIVVRYDKRGIGQSGGRAESASLVDYADDARAAVQFLMKRKDVDPKRIAIVGHSEGGVVALLAASRDKRVKAIGLIATPGSTGADIVLAQQQHLLERSTMSSDEKQAKVDLQKRIHEAVVTGKGWDQLPPEIRKAVDNPEFQSLLMNDPVKVMPGVRQPILIVQGELDTQVAPDNADRLEELARKRKHAAAVQVVKVPGVNHLLVPAKTGEAEEYGALPEKHVSTAVTGALVSWLKTSL